MELNRYVYAANNPVNAMDPSGQFAEMIGALTPARQNAPKVGLIGRLTRGLYARTLITFILISAPTFAVLGSLIGVEDIVEDLRDVDVKSLKRIMEEAQWREYQKLKQQPKPEREPKPQPTYPPPPPFYPTETPESEQIWRAISTDPNRTSFNWRPGKNDSDGLSGTRGGVEPYHLDPVSWFLIAFKRPPGSNDRVVASTEEILITAGYSVISSRTDYDPWHVSIGGITPGVVIRGGQPSWPGDKPQREQIANTLQGLFVIQIWP